MSTEAHVNAYLKTRVMTASPEELRLMLLDGAIRFANMARQGITERQPETAYNGFKQCREIVLELINSMRPEVSPDVCRNVAAILTYVYKSLIEASHERDLAKLDEAISLIQYERDTWALLMEQITAEISGTAHTTATKPTQPRQTLTRQTMPQAPAATIPNAPTKTPYQPLSIQG